MLCIFITPKPSRQTVVISRRVATRARRAAVGGDTDVSYFLDSNRNFRIGTTVQLISAATNGQAVANIPAIKTTDHWTNVLFEFGFSF